MWLNSGNYMPPGGSGTDILGWIPARIPLIEAHPGATGPGPGPKKMPNYARGENFDVSILKIFPVIP